MGIKISVAMCTFNGARYIEDQLRSLANQNRHPDELIICDDRSTDSTVDIIKRFAKTAPFQVDIRINETNLSSTKNFQRAIGLCSGDIIALSDQDDVWYSEKLRLIEDAFVCNPSIGATFSDADIVDQDLKHLGYRLWEVLGFDQQERWMTERRRLFDVLLKRNVVTGATMAFKRKYIERILPIPGVWVHDGWIALMISATEAVMPIEKPLIMYRQHAANQIGALKTPWLAEIGRAQTKTSLYDNLVRQYEVALEMISALPGCKNESESLRKKVKHAQRRAELSRRGRLERWLGVAQEALMRRYHRYSNGWRSVARDLVQR